MKANTPGNIRKRFGAVTLGALCLLGLGSPASGQVSAVDEPYVVVVDAKVAPLRCGADELYYEVSKAERGSMLLVDASDTFGIDGDGWLRVSFSGEQHALVKALPEQLDVDEMRGTLTLLRPSRLIAFSIDGDLSQSWKKLLAKPMAPGSTLKIIETIRDENGEPLAYVVPAPGSARGFIHGRFVRQANAGETRAFHEGLRAAESMTIAANTEAAPDGTIIAQAPTAGAPTMTEPMLSEPTLSEPMLSEPMLSEPTMTDPVDAVEPVSTVAQRDTTREPAGDVGALLGVSSAPAENTEDAPAMAQTHAAAPIPTTTVPDESMSTVAGADEDDGFEVYESRAVISDGPADEPVATEPLENRPLPTMRDLESAYAAVLAQKVSLAEVDPLIGEHQRYLAAMDKGEAPGDDLDREVLVAHLELLKIRSDLQRSMLRIEGVREQAQRSIVRINKGIDGIDRSSEYVVVGRLTTSVVYDGKRLPLLYRVQSIDEDAGRTLAYVVPAKGIDIAGSLGSIVGVAGTARIDASSRLNIVTPERVDRLRAGSTTAAAQ